MKQTLEKFLNLLLIVVLFHYVGFIISYGLKCVADNERTHCMQKVYTNYNEKWQNECAKEKKSKDCQLSVLTANNLNEDLKREEGQCERQFDVMMEMIK